MPTWACSSNKLVSVCVSEIDADRRSLALARFRLVNGSTGIDGFKVSLSGRISGARFGR